MSQQPTVKVGGTELEPEWYDDLDLVSVDLELRLTGRAELRFSDESFEHVESGKFKIGAKVDISFPLEDGSAVVPVFKGEVVAVEIEQPPGGLAEFVVTADDWTHRLGRVPTVKTFLETKFSDLVTAVAKGGTVQVDATTLALPYYIQRGTALEVIEDCCDRTGYDWWVDEAGTMHFKKPGSGAAVQVKLGEDLLAFSSRLSSFVPSAVEARGWDRDGQQLVKGKGTKAARPGAKSTFETKNDAAPFGAEAVQLVDIETPGVAAEAADLASSTLNHGIANALAGSAELECMPKIRLRSLLDVTEAGSFTGKYLVTRVQHTFTSAGGASTRVRTGRRTPTSIVDVLAPTPTSPNAHFTTGTVTAVDGSSEHLGQVKVKFPVLGDAIESAWARVATMGGGDDRGFSFLPDVGDEVLIGFERGDSRYPIVLGGLLGKKHAGPAVAEGDKIVSRRLRSGSGNEMLFDDTADKPVIKFTLGDTKKSLEFTVDGVTLASDRPVTIEVKGSKIVIDADKGILIDSTKPVKISSADSISLDSKKDISLKAATGIAIDGGVKTDIKGKMVNVESAGPAAIKGKPVQVN